MEEALTVNQQTALQISSSGSRISNPRQLAELRMAMDADGKRSFPRYGEMDKMERLSWLGDQFFGLAVLTHTSAASDTVVVDSIALDGEIMENGILRDLTLVEMQEAFRKGINNEYGDYFGLTSVSLLGFLKGFVRSEKKVAASSIIYKAESKKELEANERFFKELHEAHMAGKIELPDFSGMRINGPQKKRTYTDEELSAHREKVRRQAEEIFRRANKDKGNEA